MDFYYIRVSTVSQNTDRQFDGIEIPADQLFQDKISGAKKSRPQLDQLIKTIRPGDTIHVWSIDRAARNVKHLLELIETINGKGASVHFHKESMIFTGEDNPIQKMQLQIIGAVAEFQRSMINEAAAEGRALAMEKGVKFGRKSKLSPAQITEVKRQKKAGKTIKAIAIDFDVSRPAIYRALETAA